MIEVLKILNDKQKEIVANTDGVYLVLAGAGTGKTRVITARTVYILAKTLAKPWQILALTFTNKAAKEMSRRIELGIPNESFRVEVAKDLWMGTFHSICLRILRSNAARIGLQQNFIIFGED